jgi:hypothetical protein
LSGLVALGCDYIQVDAPEIATRSSRCRACRAARLVANVAHEACGYASLVAARTFA